jgi:2-dehydro-3-deoxyphosphogluconate aldolase/(4S)-4-hydroxy-2-oxoglutarate aldolase
MVFGKPLIAILRGLPAEASVRLAHAVWDTGLGLVELPVQTPAAFDALAAVAEAAARRGEQVGAGTVVTREQVARAAALGAAFTVAPGLDLDIRGASEAAGMPHLPGVGTATEVQRAVAAGVGWVKVFPAGALGADWIRQLRGPFPDVHYVATGGVDAANAASFLAAGASALGVGGAVARDLPALAALLAGWAGQRPDHER